MRPQTLTRRVGAGLSVSPEAAEAAGQAAREARAALGGAPVDLAYVFLSADHFAEAEQALEAVEEELAPAHVLGCVAEGVVARDRELEDGPAAAVWAASLPDAVIETFQSVALDTDEGVAVDRLPGSRRADLVTLLVDPFTFPAAGFLSKLNEERRRAARRRHRRRGRRAGHAGAASATTRCSTRAPSARSLRGVPVRTVVSQGCGPVGRESVITRAEENVVFELAGEPALERLKGDLGDALARAGAQRRARRRARRPRDRREPRRVPARRLPDARALGRGRGDRRDRRRRERARRPDAALPRPRRRLGRRGPPRGARGRAERRPGRRRAALHLQRPRHGHVRRARPRRRAVAASCSAATRWPGSSAAARSAPSAAKPFLHGFTATAAIFLQS